MQTAVFAWATLVSAIANCLPCKIGRWRKSSAWHFCMALLCIKITCIMNSIIMKHRILLFIVMLCATTATAQFDMFQNLDFSKKDKTNPIGIAHWKAKEDMEVAILQEDATTQSLCIEGSYEANAPGFFYQQQSVKLKSHIKIRISAAIKIEQLSEGTAGIYCYTKNGEQWLQYKTAKLDSLTDGWQRVETEIVVSPKADRLRIGASLDGKGKLRVKNFQMALLDIGTCPIGADAKAFMQEVMGVIAAHSLYKDEINTTQLLKDWQYLAACSEDMQGVYNGLSIILQSIDNHSFYWTTEQVQNWQAPSEEEQTPDFPLSKGHRIDEHYAYLWMPHFSSGDSLTGVHFATHMQQLIDSLDHKNLKGWVLDLRQNQGGNCWPMLAGIGPILGEGICGYFKAEEELMTWSYANGTSYIDETSQYSVEQPYAPLNKKIPIAVLTGGKTASSGEVVTLAFKNRPNTKSFGQHTGGYSTGNANHTLSDGSMLFLASSVYADRAQNVYPRGIAPDMEVLEEEGKDAPLEAALTWLREQ